MIKIDMGSVIEGLEDHSGLVHYYLDKQSGAVTRISEEVDSDEEQQAFYDQVEAEPDRWVEIEPMASRDSFRVMEDFVGELPESEERRTLIRALSWKKPFANFKAALMSMPELRTQWFDYHDRRMNEVAADWLAGQGIGAQPQ